MPLVSVPAVYDGQQVRLLEAAPVREPYRVLVTFVEPTGAPTHTENRSVNLRSLKGVWRGVDLSLAEIQVAEYKMPEGPQ
ncbi:MAG: hypothetical protein HY782_25630 [Chloroflexi bacterium]|nr:hypothetical protein [Chloroflexota bacterium]